MKIRVLQTGLTSVSPVLSMSKVECIVGSTQGEPPLMVTYFR
jgi:hypothetical protein